MIGVKFKITFKKPKKTNFFIYSTGDDNNDSYLINFLKNKKFFIYRGFKEVNFFNFLYTIKNSGLKNFKEKYFENILKFTKPKLAITSNDLIMQFYSIKKIDKRIKLIVIQNGGRFEKDLIKLRGFSVDYFFTFGKYHTKQISRFVKAKFVEIGSFRNNFYKNSFVKNKSLVFVSVLKESHGQMSPGEKKILEFLNLFCDQNNFKLCIFGRKPYNNKLKKIYLKYLKNINFEFLDNQKSYISFYELYKKYNYFIFERSTAAYESTALGKKTLVFNYKNLDKKWYKKFDLIDNFPFDNKNARDGEFWTHRCDLSQFVFKLNNVIQMDNMKWNRISKKLINNTMIYDKNNSKLKKILNKLSK